MRKKVAQRAVVGSLADLIEKLQQVIQFTNDANTIYVDAYFEVFEETLTDGSKTYDIRFKEESR